MRNAMEGCVTPKGLKFTVVGIKIAGQDIHPQEGILSDNIWGEIKEGDMGTFDSFFGTCKVIETFENENIEKGWFIAEKIYE